MHAAVPTAYVPAGHDVAMYEQVDLPAAEKLPLAHGAQKEAPSAPLKVPAEQGVGSTEKGGQNEPAGQSKGEPDEQ